MTNLYHFIYRCFRSMAIWNPSDNKIGRAVFGLSIAIVNYFNSVVFLLAAYFNISLKGHGYAMGLLMLILLVSLNYLNLKYFGDVNIHPSETKKSLPVGNNIMVIIGLVIFFGSFLALGLTGKFYSVTLYN